MEVRPLGAYVSRVGQLGARWSNGGHGTCHGSGRVGGRGGSVGPALDGIAGRFDRDYFTQWLTDPTAIRPETTMPKLPLTEAQIGDLSDYLASLEN